MTAPGAPEGQEDAAEVSTALRVVLQLEPVKRLPVLPAMVKGPCTSRVKQEPKANKIISGLPVLVTDPHEGIT